MLKKYNFGYFVLGLCALLVGFAGQLFLRSSQPLPFSIVLYAFSIILLVFALHKGAGPQVRLSIIPSGMQLNRSRLGYLFGGLAIIFLILAFWLFDSTVSPLYPWLLHIFSIVFLILSIVLLDGTKGLESSKDTWSRPEIFALVLIFIIAAFMRLYRFDQIPYGTWFDEADEGLIALRIMNESDYLPVFADSTLLPAHYIYLIVLFFKILGVSTLSIRAISVMFGLATVGAAYLTGKELFNQKFGLVVAFLMAISRWDINWSRIGMHGVTVPFFELMAVGFLLRAFRRQSLIDYAISGLSMGFGLCFYPPLRFFPFVVALFLVVLWLNRRDLINSAWRGMIVLSLGGIVAATPVLYLIAFQSDLFWSRMQYISIFNGKTSEEGWRAVAQTTREHLLMFNFQGDRNGRHNLPGEPMMDSVGGTLMVLGVALCLWRIKQPGSFLILAWLLLMLIPGIFSLDFESPQSLRSIGSLPAACILAAIPLHSLWQEWEKIPNRRSDLLFMLPLLVVLGVSGFLNYDIYFNKQAKSSDSWSAFSTSETIAGKIMADLGNSVEYYVSTFYFKTPTINFLAPEVTDYHRLETYDTLPLPMDGEKGAVFFFDLERKPFLLQAESYYPSATFTEFKAPDGTPVLFEVYLSPSDIQASQGLTASYYLTEDWTGEPFLVRSEKNLNFDWQNGEPVPFPFYVEWKGILFAPAYGNYRFTAHSPSPVELVIDEVPVLQGGNMQAADISLAQGNHTVRIRTEAANGHFELDWRTPVEEDELPIPSSAFLLPPYTNNGLLGRYYANPEWAGPPALAKIDSWINFYFHQIVLPRPYTVEWTGSINIQTAGQYLFGLESIDESSLWIDGQQVLDVQTLGQYQEAGINLSSGFHSIRVRYGDRTSYTHVNLYWTPPGQGREIIPQRVLFPPQGDPSLLLPNPEK
ncbi:MAG: glycosyltransferase family 39 protein [Anaerolineales bacterium]|nr:glycosyltransferase family 39 protein [Anaerolineales bacterium]